MGSVREAAVWGTKPLKAAFGSPLIYNLEQTLAQAIENPIDVTAISSAEGILG